MGIELHWVDALTGGDLSRWLPLAAPSDFLYFLPTRGNVDPRKKLRLISSAAGPKAGTLTRADSSSVKWKYWPTSSPHGRRQSMTRLFLGNLPFPTTAVSTGEWSHTPSPLRRQSDGLVGVSRTVDCDHYGAIPISDATHLLFTDPVSGFLCLGADAPRGGSTKLLRKVVFIHPSAGAEHNDGPIPWRYTAGKELGWGVRVVAAYHDGTTVLYNVPRDLFKDLQDPQKLSSTWDENQGVIGQSDLLTDSVMDHQGSISTVSTNAEASSSNAVQIIGAELMRVEDDIIEELAVDTSFGGFSLWIFCRSGIARRYNIHTSQDQLVRTRYVGENGLLYQSPDGMIMKDADKEAQSKDSVKSEDQDRKNSLHVKWA